jgi:DNA polymerase/3'-5' exonuclease PolX
MYLVSPNNMEYAQALHIARQIIEELKPHCYRVAIAGSLRRKCAFVNDIEIVAIPRPYDIGMFATGIATIVNKWPKIIGELPCKNTRRQLPEGINLDLYLVTEANWDRTIRILSQGPCHNLEAERILR